MYKIISLIKLFKSNYWEEIDLNLHSHLGFKFLEYWMIICANGFNPFVDYCVFVHLEKVLLWVMLI